jgi:hypothetical protein
MDDFTSPAVLTARRPDDLLAMVPVVLGFVPDHSLVMLTFGPRQFHARIDLPHGQRAVREAAEALLDPLRRSGAHTVAFVVYGDDDRLARQALRPLRRGCRAAGVAVAEALRSHEGRWFPLLGEPTCGPGVPYDVSAHPFVAEAVLRGHVVHGSRSELSAMLATDPEAVAEVEAAYPTAPAEPPWVRHTLDGHLGGRTRLDAGEAARLLAALADPDCRDAAWSRMTRATGREEVEMWVDLVRRCPEPLVHHAAAVLAFASWVAGDGALAWCAVDRSAKARPGHPLATLVSEFLDSATPPDEWEVMRSLMHPA